MYMAGELKPWHEAQLHVGCEAVIRGLNVFEGLKGYWQVNGRFAVLQVKDHYDRLKRSARLLQIPWKYSLEEYEAALDRLAGALLQPDHDMWFRTTLFAVEGHWGEGTVSELVITGFQQPMTAPETVRLGVSTWRRSPDVALPARIKTGSNYQVSRLARIEAKARGVDDMVLLNENGRVAEATGACIVMVRNGCIFTPPASEGALESITIAIVQELAATMRIPFERRPIDRTELLVADEIALCGTLAELVLVDSIEGLPLTSRLLREMQDRYFQMVRGAESHPRIMLTELGNADSFKETEFVIAN